MSTQGVRIQSWAHKLIACLFTIAFVSYNYVNATLLPTGCIFNRVQTNMC
jgi:hypothetical protein